MTYRTELQHDTEVPSCGTERAVLEKTKIIIKRRELTLRSILWPKHGISMPQMNISGVCVTTQ
jgi:hypothetical protein